MLRLRFAALGGFLEIEGLLIEEAFDKYVASPYFELGQLD